MRGYVQFRANVEVINEKHDNIVIELFHYIESRKKNKLTNFEKEKIFENFSHFLMDNGYSDEYSEIISAFVISKESDVIFKEELGAIKEGLILYQGINYSADINQLGSWKDKLTIYLSTEHLFNCLGYNGTLFEEIFNDFLKLVNEINRSHKTQSGEKLIELKFLDETQDEIDHFFKSAESIKKGYKRLDSSKQAMSYILKGTNDVSDIKEKQVNFFLELKRKGITHQEFSFDINKSQYNVVDLSVIERLQKMSEEKKMPFDEEYCMTCLRIFTKINTFRRGKNNVPFEKIEHIYVTENSFAKYLGHNNVVKFGENDTTFAKDIDYIITKFWFKLKKGFNDKAALPKSFDFVTKAKIIIASHINNRVTNNYIDLQTRFRNGKLTEEQAIELSHAYKEKPNAPELVTLENIDESLDFLHNENFIEDFLRERSRKEAIFIDTLKEKESLEQELNFYRQKELDEERKKAEQEDENRRIAALNKINEESILFGMKQWTIIHKANIRNLLYLIAIILITSLPIGIGLFLKLYSPIDEWLEKNTTYQVLIGSFLTILFLIEIFGRSYIFNKEKIKDGWSYLIIVLSFRFKHYKSNKINKLIEEYKKQQ